MSATTLSLKARRAAPRVLVVDDEPAMRDLARDLLAKELPARLHVAGSIAEARRVIDRNAIDLLVVDIHLPDGDGLTLVDRAREKNPAAQAVVITGAPTADNSIAALRLGAIDYLPKPFTAQQMTERLGAALHRQQQDARDTRRLGRLREAVKRLNRARKTVSKKVDLLCNDLVHAYTDLAKQLEEVRTQEDFRTLLAGAKDLEQLLCHAMDWVLRRCGYSNIAIYLVGDDQQYELGAYMKYTIPGARELTDAMRDGLVQRVARDGLLLAEGTELTELLSPAELKLLLGQSMIGTNCNYLGESLAVMLVYRDEKHPLTREDAEILRAIAPLFATALATLVRHEEQGGSDVSEDDLPGDDLWGEEGPREEDGERDRNARRPRRRDKAAEADWWKRGEPPPF
jgi:response regulator of citrate/malate metabolism